MVRKDYFEKVKEILHDIDFTTRSEEKGAHHITFA